MLNLARWAVAHRRAVVVLWIVLLVAAFGASRAVGTRVANNFSLPNTDSQRAADVLKSRFPAQAGDSDQIVLHARDGKLSAAPTRERVTAMLDRVQRLPHVTGVRSPYAGGSHAISRDGTIGFATVYFDKRADELPKDAVQKVIDTAQAARSPGLQVELGGQAIEQAQQASLGFATATGLVAAVVILLISFGSVLAMGLPILTALFGLGVGLSIIALGSHVVDMADASTELALMIGLGVGIDYALFIVTRYREAYRANGGDVGGAVELAMNTAGRAIVFAGTTVVIALMGMFALGIDFLYGVAVAASVGVLLVLAASLTLLPALLSFAGRRIGRSRRGGGAAAAEPSRAGFWTRWIGIIQRRPWWAAVGATALMLLLAAPALGLRLGSSDAGNDRASTTTRKAYDLLAEGFGKGVNGPLLVAARLPSAGESQAVGRLAGALRQTPGVAAVATPRVNPARDTAALTVYPRSSPQSEQTSQLVSRLRDDVIPPVARATGATVYVGGVTAAQEDFSHVLASKLPLFIAIVVLLSAALLLVVFRSFVIPIQAALMNLLSIGASLGVVQAIFQRGWLGDVFGVQPGPIEAFIPVIVFAIVFGLSMDYEVFLVSRIHEEWMKRDDNSAAVHEGLVRTGRVITAAAAVMVAVFASFVLGGERVLQLFGLSMASAVFLDAFVIRMILLPAVLELLGRRTWWFPHWLHSRLPRLAIEPA